MNDNKSKVLFGGVTTQFEVKKLMDAFETKVDDIVEHSAIAAACGAEWKSSRYAAIVQAWRKALSKERNVAMKSIPGVGYRVLSDSGKMKESAEGVVRGSRTIGKAAKLLSTVQAEKLDGAERKTYDHQARITGALLTEATKARRTIAVHIGEIEKRPKLRAVNDGK